MSDVLNDSVRRTESSTWSQKVREVRGLYDLWLAGEERGPPQKSCTNSPLHKHRLTGGKDQDGVKNRQSGRWGPPHWAQMDLDMPPPPGRGCGDVLVPEHGGDVVEDEVLGEAGQEGERGEGEEEEQGHGLWQEGCHSLYSLMWAGSEMKTHRWVVTLTLSQSLTF